MDLNRSVVTSLTLPSISRTLEQPGTSHLWPINEIQEQFINVWTISISNFFACQNYLIIEIFLLYYTYIPNVEQILRKTSRIFVLEANSCQLSQCHSCQYGILYKFYQKCTEWIHLQIFACPKTFFQCWSDFQLFSLIQMRKVILKLNW